MTYAAATFPGVAPSGGRDFALGDCRRTIFGVVVVGLGAVAAVAVTAGGVTAIAAWLIGAAFATNPNLHANAPIALETATLIRPYRRLAAAGEFFGTARVSTHSAYAGHLTLDAELAPAAAAHLTSVGTLLALEEAAEPLNETTLPPPRSPDGRQIQAKQEHARPPAGPAVPPVAAAAFPPHASTFFNFLRQRSAPPPAHNNAISLSPPDSRMAVYDIEAHTVYLPNGDRLEAHSGLGYRLDDPRYVNEKGRGPTPPNVYDLVLREQLFHGVRAIRLNPVGDSSMFGRGGMLAHTYMLGPSGQSFGCVSFRDYPRFLRAFLRGEVDRLVVVPHLETKPSGVARARRERAGRYAFNR